MSEPRPPLSPADREAQRALLEDALAELATSGDPSRAGEVMRALDQYIEANRVAPSRESPVTDYEHREKQEIRWAFWFVIGGAVIATIILAILISGGGWAVALAIVAVWVLAIFALLNT
ncbi:MAG: hypothetical protein AB7V42_07830 [Thermoleophilia bacterium]